MFILVGGVAIRASPLRPTREVPEPRPLPLFYRRVPAPGGSSTATSHSIPWCQAGAQREMAFPTGVNIVMYAPTGNYKADLVHTPALLERLGH